MPLIILTGVPSSGKTTTVNKLKNYFENQDKKVHIVSEYEEIIKSGYGKNQMYMEPAKEKHIRGLLKSEALKLLTPTNVVIIDGLNYIKGYRYELYCGTKANCSTQCTVLTQINYEEAWKLNVNREVENEKYTRETFDALLMRYEEPDGKNRWDAPLFVTYLDQDLNLEEIFEALFKRKPPPVNKSTQNAPLSSTNFLYELNKITKEITDGIIKLVRCKVQGVVSVPGYADCTIDLGDVTVQKLIILQRQYLTYSKMHPPDIENVSQLYIQYLKSNLDSS